MNDLAEESWGSSLTLGLKVYKRDLPGVPKSMNVPTLRFLWSPKVRVDSRVFLEGYGT